MSRRRLHLWISLLVGVLVWGAYFARVALAVRDGEVGGLVYWFVGALAVVLVAETVLSGAVAWLLRRRMRALDDGPTLMAALKAGHVALMLLVGLVLLAAAVLATTSAVGADLGLGDARGQAVLANLLLGAVVIAELVRAGLTLALMPRG